MTSDQSRPVLVAALGNPLAGDDAFGPLVAAELTRRSPGGMEVIDLGMKPAGLIDHLPERKAVAVVDAADPAADFPPGQLIDLDFFDPRRPPLRRDSPWSSHGLSIAHELDLARALGLLPAAVRLFAAPATLTNLGDPPSDQTRSLVAIAAGHIMAWARQWIDLPDGKATSAW